MRLAVAWASTDGCAALAGACVRVASEVASVVTVKRFLTIRRCGASGVARHALGLTVAVGALTITLGMLAACTKSSSSGRQAAAPKTIMLQNARQRTEAPVAPGEASAAADAVAQAAKEYLELLCEISPETATSLGLHAHDDALDDRSLQFEARSLARQRAMLRALHTRFDAAALPPELRTDVKMLEGALAVAVERAERLRPLERQPDVYTSALGAVFLMTARDYAPAEQRARNVVARLEKVPSVIASAKANLRRPPRVWTEIGIERARSATSFLEAQRSFLTRALPAERARVDAALRGAEQAYVQYAEFLSKDVLPRSDGDFKAGRELFTFLLAHDLFVSDTPEALLAMGRAMVAKTQAQMNEVAKRIDPRAKGWPEVVAKLKGNHPTAEGLLDAYRYEVARARAFAAERDVVEFPPGDDLEVVDTPPFLRSTVTAAYDQPPPFDATTKGFFFVTPVDTTLPPAAQEQMLRENDHGDLVDTAVHEAYPGHHLQLSFARRHPSLVRKVLDHAVFSEGWALYAEEVMAELGYYTDEERLLQLEWTLVRAARVVVDVGLHVEGMAFDDAVQVLTDQVHLEKPLALSEVKRYSLTPTQPLSYLTGRQQILELRERYRKRDGDRFSLKAFHTDLLTRATVPPRLMAEEVFGSAR